MLFCREKNIWLGIRKRRKRVMSENSKLMLEQVKDYPQQKITIGVVLVETAEI
jgi:hypothetical protein